MSELLAHQATWELLSREFVPQLLRGTTISPPSELAMGFEPRIGKRNKEFRRFSSNIGPSSSAVANCKKPALQSL
jgi:hypothetical protein